MGRVERTTPELKLLFELEGFTSVEVGSALDSIVHECEPATSIHKLQASDFISALKDTPELDWNSILSCVTEGLEGQGSVWRQCGFGSTKMDTKTDSVVSELDALKYATYALVVGMGLRKGHDYLEESIFDTIISMIANINICSNSLLAGYSYDIVKVMFRLP